MQKQSQNPVRIELSMHITPSKSAVLTWIILFLVLDCFNTAAKRDRRTDQPGSLARLAVSKLLVDTRRIVFN